MISAVDNLTEFFQRFRQLNVRSNEQLDELVAQCQQIVRGVEPQALRDNQGLRQHVAQQLSQVENVLDRPAGGPAPPQHPPPAPVRDDHHATRHHPGRHRPLPVRRRPSTCTRSGSSPSPAVPTSNRTIMGQWWADLAPVSGPRLGPLRSPQRSIAGRSRLAGSPLAAARPANVGR